MKYAQCIISPVFTKLMLSSPPLRTQSGFYVQETFLDLMVPSSETIFSKNFARKIPFSVSALRLNATSLEKSQSFTLFKLLKFT